MTLSAATFQFYLGTHRWSWIGALDVPLCISFQNIPRHAYQGDADQLGFDLTDQPGRPVAPWFLDSGAYGQITRHGQWPWTERVYASAVRSLLARTPGCVAVSAMDYPGEPAALAATGLTIAEHQARSTDSFLTLTELAPELPLIPPLQGDGTLPIYLRHLRHYASLGIDLATYPLVGLGTVCQITDPLKVWRVVDVLNYHHGLNLHVYGAATPAIPSIADRAVSSDTMAWSRTARFGGRDQTCPAGHRRCNNCPYAALDYRHRLLDAIAAHHNLPLPSRPD